MTNLLLQEPEYQVTETETHFRALWDTVRQFLGR